MLRRWRPLQSRGKQSRRTYGYREVCLLVLWRSYSLNLKLSRLHHCMCTSCVGVGRNCTADNRPNCMAHQITTLFELSVGTTGPWCFCSLWQCRHVARIPNACSVCRILQGFRPRVISVIWPTCIFFRREAKKLQPSTYCCVMTGRPIETSMGSGLIAHIGIEQPSRVQHPMSRYETIRVGPIGGRMNVSLIEWFVLQTCWWSRQCGGSKRSCWRYNHRPTCDALWTTFSYWSLLRGLYS